MKQEAIKNTNVIPLTANWNQSKEEKASNDDVLQLKMLRADFERDILEKESSFMKANSKYTELLRASQKDRNSADLHKWWLKKKETKFLFDSITAHYVELFGEQPRIK